MIRADPQLSQLTVVDVVHDVFAVFFQTVEHGTAQRDFRTSIVESCREDLSCFDIYTYAHHYRPALLRIATQCVVCVEFAETCLYEMEHLDLLAQRVENLHCDILRNVEFVDEATDDVNFETVLFAIDAVMVLLRRVLLNLANHHVDSALHSGAIEVT